MTIQQNEVFIFLGPTLPLKKARKFLPDANFLPPVQCGDLFRILRLKPKIIAIVDGLFENTAAIWHKEILFCLEQGIQVFGSSSMGALRAAELADYGMIGVGKIFEDYKNGALNDDDEVAIIHVPEGDYTSYSDPMVNIRATLTKAITDGIIEEKDANLMKNLAKKLFYRDRNFMKIVQLSEHKGLDKKIAKDFILWLQKGGYVDLKKKDAICLLKILKEKFCTASNYHQSITPKINHTIFLRTMYRDSMCKPIILESKQLSMPERMITLACNNKSDYQLICNLAYLLAASQKLAATKNIFLNKNILKIKQSNYETVLNKNKFNCYFNAEKNAMEKRNFLDRLIQMEYLIYCTMTNHPDLGHLIEKSFIEILKIKGDYSKYRNEPDQFNNLPQFKILKLIATIWCLFELELKDNDLIPTDKAIKHYANKFRKKNNLIKHQSIIQWINANDLSLPDYYALMRFYASFSFLILENNLEALGIFNDEENDFHLLDAIRLLKIPNLADNLLNAVETAKNCAV